jgi:hypothetical protein
MEGCIRFKATKFWSYLQQMKNNSGLPHYMVYTKKLFWAHLENVSGPDLSYAFCLTCLFNLVFFLLLGKSLKLYRYSKRGISMTLKISDRLAFFVHCTFK